MSWALANSFPSPTVVFPQDLLEKGLEADNFAMLGLGDIVIPGDRAGVGGSSPWIKECGETDSLTWWERDGECDSTPTPLGQPGIW